MIVVVDLGCMTRQGVDSVSTLVDWYGPEVLYGFDPCPDLDTSLSEINGVPVVLEQAAAWLYDGTLGYVESGAGSAVAELGQTTVPCFDFSAWLARTGPCVVKMDIEGAEYPLLERIAADGTDAFILELLVEWHDDPSPIGLCCPVKEWTL